MSDSTNILAPGTILSERYEVTDEIGRGGFGTIYRARQLNINRDVAIKTLPPQFMSIPDVVERFRREAQLASRLRHPNTITIHDYGAHDDYLFIVMELLRGEDVADLLRREKRLEVPRIIEISRQVLRSLAEAHEQGIVHRDLKPENIFLTQLGDQADFVKVLDFGIAKLALPTTAEAISPEGRRLTLTGSTVGTPTYMSPEQAAGEEVDPLTDLYALGVIMYEMACGRPPFANENPVQTMRNHLFDDVPPLADPSLRGTLLERVIFRALEKEKSDRFQSANDFLAALSNTPRSYSARIPGLSRRPSTAPVNNDGDVDIAYQETAHYSSARMPLSNDNQPGEAGKRVPTSVMTVLERGPSEEEVIVLTKPKYTPKTLPKAEGEPVSDVNASDDVAVPGFQDDLDMELDKGGIHPKVIGLVVAIAVLATFLLLIVLFFIP